MIEREMYGLTINRFPRPNVVGCFVRFRRDEKSAHYRVMYVRNLTRARQ